MKIFITQKVSGLDREKLKQETKKIAETLKEIGHELIYIIDYPKEFVDLPVGERLVKYAFKQMDECDVILAIIRSEDKSEGMLMEIGHIMNTDKKIILAIKPEVQNTYLRVMAEEVVEFNDFEDLLNKLKEVKWQ